jgi:hypothetical protein
VEEPVENAIHDIDADDWERLCSDILRAEDYDVKSTTSGSGGDGGKDAWISCGGGESRQHS